MVANGWGYKVNIVEIENHKYIVATGCGAYGRGASIIHAESCNCKKIEGE